MKRTIAHLLLCLSLFGLNAGGQTVQATPKAASVRSEKFRRTELYFGLSRKNGPPVTDAEWQTFLAEVVTPRFPDGFTSVKGFGQYRGKDGGIIAEPSEILIFLYPAGKRKESSEKIEVIRTSYVKRFDQESVMRVDLRKPVDVSF